MLLIDEQTAEDEKRLSEIGWLFGIGREGATIPFPQTRRDQAKASRKTFRALGPDAARLDRPARLAAPVYFNVIGSCIPSDLSTGSHR
jgi:hypothetical protein